MQNMEEMIWWRCWRSKKRQFSGKLKNWFHKNYLQINVFRMTQCRDERKSWFWVKPFSNRKMYLEKYTSGDESDFSIEFSYTEYMARSQNFLFLLSVLKEKVKNQKKKRKCCDNKKSINKSFLIKSAWFITSITCRNLHKYKMTKKCMFYKSCYCTNWNIFQHAIQLHHRSIAFE